MPEHDPSLSHAGQPAAMAAPVASESDATRPVDLRRGVRKWLEENRVFFETIAATLLSVMAIIISWQQTSISRTQTELAQLQTTIARQQSSPQFVLDARQVRLEGQENVVEDRIYVTNHGGIARDLGFKSVVFFDMKIARHTRPAEFTEHEISINAYYDSTFHSASGTGEVLTLAGYQNQIKFIALEREFRDAASKRNWSGTLDIRRYVRLSYVDIFDERHTEFYFVRQITGGVKVPPDKAEPVFKRHDDSFSAGELKNFYDLTVEKLFEIAEKPGRKNNG